ncbi:unnamed protein product [Amoebophrya sp. A120]|nr:unnamed protein product [Amoebophrya sp. A120]|eukprot:GSA120T00004786001.1
MATTTVISSSVETTTTSPQPKAADQDGMDSTSTVPSPEDLATASKLRSGFEPPTVDEELNSLMNMFRYRRGVLSGTTRPSKIALDPRLQFRSVIGEDVVKEVKKELQSSAGNSKAAAPAAPAKDAKGAAAASPPTDAAADAGGGGDGLPQYESVKQILESKEKGMQSKRQKKINQYIYSADPKYREVKKHLGRYYRLKYKHRYASSEDDDESKPPKDRKFFPNEAFFRRVRNLFNDIPYKEPENCRKFVDRMYAFYKTHRELYCNPREDPLEKKEEDPNFSTFLRDAKEMPPGSAITAAKISKRLSSSRFSAAASSTQSSTEQPRAVYSPTKRTTPARPKPTNWNFTRPDSAKRRPQSATQRPDSAKFRSSRPRPLSALSTRPPSTSAFERPQSSFAASTASMSQSRPWSAFSRRPQSATTLRPSSAARRPASATARPIAEIRDRHLPRPHSAKASYGGRPHSALGTSSTFDASTSRPSSGTTRPGSRPTSAVMRPHSAQTAELRRIANMTRPSSASSLRSVGTFRSHYPLPAEALEVDEFEMMMAEDIPAKQPKTPAEAMQQRWLEFRQKELEDKARHEEIQAAIANWREFRTRVEENTVRRQDSASNLRPSGPNVYLTKPRPQSAPASRTAAMAAASEAAKKKSASQQDEDATQPSEFDLFDAEGVMAHGYLQNGDCRDQKTGDIEMATIEEDVRKTEMQRLRHQLANFLHEPEELPAYSRIQNCAEDVHAEDLETCKLWSDVHKTPNAYLDRRAAQLEEIQLCKQKLAERGIPVAEKTLTEALLRPYENFRVKDGISVAVPLLQFNPYMADPMLKFGKKKGKKKK